MNVSLKKEILTPKDMLILLIEFWKSEDSVVEELICIG